MANIITGIYCIENTINNKKYFGQSVDIYKRLQRHKRLLINNKHNNEHLQNAYNMYGEDSFKFYIIEECDYKSLDDFERYYILQYKTYDREYGYNIELGGKSNGPMSDETKEKLRKANIGKKMSEETKQKISKSNTGMKMPDSQRNALRLYHTGLRHSKETKRKIGIASRKENRSPETLRKMSESSKRENLSEETLQKMSESHKGFHHTEETKEKLSKCFKGKTLSEEARNNISKGHIGIEPWNKGKELTQEHKDKVSESVKGLKNGHSNKYKVIDLNGNVMIMCGNDIYNKRKDNPGILNINKKSFEKYILPINKVDINYIKSLIKVKNGSTKKMLENLQSFDGWIIEQL